MKATNKIVILSGFFWEQNNNGELIVSGFSSEAELNKFIEKFGEVKETTRTGNNYRYKLVN
jgi:hypothetical protein